MCGFSMKFEVWRFFLGFWVKYPAVDAEIVLPFSSYNYSNRQSRWQLVDVGGELPFVVEE